jgi:H+/Cl- antiporter ClcA
MTAEEHNKTLATLWFIYGAMHGLTLLALLLLVFVVKFAAPGTELISTSWLVAGVLVFVVLLLIVGLLPLLAGYAFRKRRPWARPLGLALAALSLINIPVGTALGIYSIKFLRSVGGVRLYGGKAATADENELQDARRGARPLMDLADRLK